MLLATLFLALAATTVDPICITQAKPVETFTMALTGSGTAGTLTLEWEDTRVTVLLAVVK